MTPQIEGAGVASGEKQSKAPTLRKRTQKESDQRRHLYVSRRLGFSFRAQFSWIVKINEKARGPPNEGNPVIGERGEQGGGKRRTSNTGIIPRRLLLKHEERRGKSENLLLPLCMERKKP